MSNRAESYAKELMSCFQYPDHLYQLICLKFKSLKSLLCRTKKLYQITYRLFGTLRIAQNIDWQNAYPARVTALA
ncbi:hypothetical protein [Nostoc sp.]|uniref:hypothetical protein n=1 Tax=Nostoc sp. TaxID=1180 RepID=UPI002FF732DE